MLRYRLVPGGPGSFPRALPNDWGRVQTRRDMIHNIVLDDVNSWVKDTTAETIKNKGAATCVDISGNKKSPWIVCTLFNMVQHCFFKRCGEHLRHVEVHSPGQILTKPNWASLRDRLRKWASSFSGFCGFTTNLPHRDPRAVHGTTLYSRSLEVIPIERCFSRRYARHLARF